MLILTSSLGIILLLIFTFIKLRGKKKTSSPRYFVYTKRPLYKYKGEVLYSPLLLKIKNEIKK